MARNSVEDPHEHSWAAAILFHLDEDQMKAAAEFPDDLLDVAATAPSETVGPFCLECLAFFDV